MIIQYFRQITRYADLSAPQVIDNEQLSLDYLLELFVAAAISFCASIEPLKIMAFYPLRLSPIRYLFVGSVVLPSTFFRHHLTMDTLTGSIVDFHRQDIRPPPCVSEQHQLRRCAPYLTNKKAAPQKRNSFELNIKLRDIKFML